jgi:hypothetical protein
MAATLYPGRHALKNRERLNRLLMLLQLCVTGDDDARVYAGAIRTHLESSGGRPLRRWGALADPAHSHSLRR